MLVPDHITNISSIHIPWINFHSAEQLPKSIYNRMWDIKYQMPPSIMYYMWFHRDLELSPSEPTVTLNFHLLNPKCEAFIIVPWFIADVRKFGEGISVKYFPRYRVNIVGCVQNKTWQKHHASGHTTMLGEGIEIQYASCNAGFYHNHYPSAMPMIIIDT